MSLALTDLTNESEIIIGVYAKSHPYLHLIKSVNCNVHENNITTRLAHRHTTSNNDMLQMIAYKMRDLPRKNLAGCKETVYWGTNSIDTLGID